MKYSKTLIKWEDQIMEKYKGWKLIYFVGIILAVGGIFGIIGGVSFQNSYAYSLILIGVVLVVNRFIYGRINNGI